MGCTRCERRGAQGFVEDSNLSAHPLQTFLETLCYAAMVCPVFAPNPAIVSPDFRHCETAFARVKIASTGIDSGEALQYFQCATAHNDIET